VGNRAGSTPALGTALKNFKFLSIKLLPQFIRIEVFVFIKMAHTYILYSKNIDTYYIGSCLNLVDRFEEHKKKLFKNSFTSKTDDWELFFALDNLDYAQARNIDLHIKNMKSRKYIENLKKYDNITEKLRLKYSTK